MIEITIQIEQNGKDMRLDIRGGPKGKVTSGESEAGEFLRLALSEATTVLLKWKRNGTKIDVDLKAPAVQTPAEGTNQ